MATQMDTQRILVEFEGQRTFGSHRRSWEDHMKIVLRERGCEMVG